MLLRLLLLLDQQMRLSFPEKEITRTKALVYIADFTGDLAR